MKKLFAILIVLCMAVALFAGCQTNTPVETPTEAPEVTDAPSEATPTEAPTDTPEPTATPEPTPEPFKDPYAVEILDWIDAEGQNSSFDSIFIDSKKVADGDVQAWKADNDETVDGTSGKIKTVSMRGWAGFFDYKMKDYGYQIDNNPVQWVKKAKEMTEPAVIAAGGDNAERFNVKIPVTGITGAGHEIKIVVRLDDEDGSLAYLNNEAGPFVIYFDGPEAAEAAIDGSIASGEYNAQYSLTKSNAQTWTGSEIDSANIQYYLSLKEDGLYVGIDASGIASGDKLQLAFNPGARLEDTQPLFITFVAGDSLKILQENHGTALKGEAADITDLIEAKIVAKEGGYVIEAKIPADFFSVSDVEKADQFVYGRENLYFGMFAILGGSNGFTNQSAAPGSDWSCKALALHEYVAY